MSELKMKLYDVLNDYSLCDKVSDKSKEEASTNTYTWRRGKYQGHSVLLGWHKKYDELHYVKAPDNINLVGQYIIWD